jgi:hypothetical protein
MSDDPPADTLEFWVRFVCGVLVGAVIGVGSWMRYYYGMGAYGWLIIPGAALF